MATPRLPEALTSLTADGTKCSTICVGTQYTFSHKEVAEILIRKQDLHEGIWTVAFQLSMGVTHAPSPTGGDPVPAAVVSILSIGLQKLDKDDPSSVDAAKVNPATK